MVMVDNSFDVIVLGAGPGGYVAAIRASQNGLRVAIVESGSLGGVCLNIGCIPTKSLLHAAHTYKKAKKKEHLNELGINFTDVSFDMLTAVKYAKASASMLSKGVEALMLKNKIKVFHSRGVIQKDKSVQLEDGNKILAKNIIIATGSRAKQIKTLEVDGNQVWNYQHALFPEQVPKSIAIVGSGAIGIEFADIYNCLGSEVHIFEMQEFILQLEDREISKIAQFKLEQDGIKIYTNAQVEIVSKTDELCTLLDKKTNKRISVEKILVAVGISPNSENIGLENFSNIKIDDNGFIVTNDTYTGESGIYAIGDVTGGLCLAHKASHEGMLCADKISNIENLHNFHLSMIPRCIYCDPQIASIGITEEEAKNMKLDYKVGKAKQIFNGKSATLRKKDGLVKVIFDKKTDEILGAHMIGTEVTEMIHSLNIAVSLEATSEWLSYVNFPHPTISEILFEAILDANKKSIHS